MVEVLSTATPVQQASVWLIYVTVFFLVIVGAFLVKFLIELSKLIGVSNDIMVTVKYELEPTLREIRTTLENVNVITSGTMQKLYNARTKLSDGANRLSSACSNFSKIVYNVIKTLIAK